MSRPRIPPTQWSVRFLRIKPSSHDNDLAAVWGTYIRVTYVWGIVQERLIKMWGDFLIGERQSKTIFVDDYFK